MHRDRRPGLAVRARAGPQDALGPRRHPLVLDDALEERRLDPGAGDALGDVAGEVGDHRVDLEVDQQARAAELVLVGDRVVEVQPGRHDDVEVRLTGDPLDPRDVAAEAPHRRVDDRVDPEAP